MALQIAAPASSATLPGSEFADLAAPAPPASEGDDVTAGELGWRAALAAGLAGQRDTDIVSYQLTVPGRAFTPMEENYLSNQLRSYAGASEYQTFPDIGTVPLSTLTQQLSSNVAVLESALPAGTVLGAHQLVIPLDGSADDYAFEVDLKVTNLSSLSKYEGDLVDGLGTGLIGGPTAPAEGLAINVVDSQGLRASWWSAERAGTGMGISDPILTSSGDSETATFPDITGGPAPSSFGSGGGGASSSNATGWPLEPPRALGPASTGESKANLERALHQRTPRCASCYRSYHSRRGKLLVGYVNGRIDEIESNASKITLDGMRLGLGPRKLHKALRHWRHFTCEGYDTYQEGSGPTTTIAFGHDHYVNVDIIAEAGGGCGAP